MLSSNDIKAISKKDAQQESTQEVTKQPNSGKTKPAHYKDLEPLGNRNREQLMSMTSQKPRSRIKIIHHGKKHLLKTEGFLTAKNLLELMLEEVYQPFRIQLTRGVNLDQGTKMCVPIEFLPELVGNFQRVEDQLVVSYEGKFLTREEEVSHIILHF